MKKQTLAEIEAMFKFRYITKVTPTNEYSTVAEFNYVSPEEILYGDALLKRYQDGDPFNTYKMSRKACKSWFERADRSKTVIDLPEAGEVQPQTVKVFIKITKNTTVTLKATDFKDVEKQIDEMDFEGRVSIRQIETK